MISAGRTGLPVLPTIWVAFKEEMIVFFDAPPMAEARLKLDILTAPFAARLVKYQDLIREKSPSAAQVKGLSLVSAVEIGQK